MQKLVNLFWGSVTVEVHGSYPERFLNLCARYGIRFWDMQSLDIGVFKITMRAKSFLKIAPIAKKSMCRVHIISKNGFPFSTRRVRTRHVLIMGGIAFCFAAWIFTGFVWSINIDGFEGLDEKKLTQKLSEEGLKIGAIHGTLNIDALRNNILIDMPELAYIYVNFNGAEANVIARQRKAPPEILPATVPCDIVADKDGIINSITVKTGTPEVVKGDTVIKGQLLASGYITGREGTTVMTHADAEITIKTWKTINAKMQKKVLSKMFTGREKNCYTIILFGNRIKLYTNSRISYAKCDKIIKTNNLTVSDIITLPLSLECATYREYELCEEVLRDEQAFEAMGETLALKLSAYEDCEVLDTKLRTHSDESFAYAEITAECVEKIGVKRKLLKDG